MAAIGSLVFCIDCGNLLPASKGTERNVLSCECCGAENKGQLVREMRNVRGKALTVVAHTDTGSKTIVTETKPSDFPSQLRQKLQSSVQSVERHNIQTDAIAQERCPKCGREEVRYTSVQMRGADEGSTNIYNCECGHSYVPQAVSRSRSFCSHIPGGTRITEEFSNLLELQNTLIYHMMCKPLLF
jgi:DNA-directed RNA polymerase I subunit RPA12